MGVATVSHKFPTGSSIMFFQPSLPLNDIIDGQQNNKSDLMDVFDDPLGTFSWKRT